MRRAMLFTVAALAMAGCAQRTTEATQPATRIVRYSAGDDVEPAVIEVRGVQVTIAAPVANGLSVVSNSGSLHMLIGMDGVPPVQPNEDPACRFWLRGRPIVVSDGHLRIGSNDYGAVAAGDAVAIDASGVRVGGALRGELPDSSAR